MWVMDIGYADKCPGRVAMYTAAPSESLGGVCLAAKISFPSSSSSAVGGGQAGIFARHVCA